MRILHVLRTVNPAEGGPVEGVRQLSKANRRHGHSCEVVCVDDPAAPWLDRLGIPVHAVGPARGAFGYSSRLTPWIREHAPNYDAVVINGIWQYCCFGAGRVLRELGLPYFVFTHGMLDPWFKRRYPFKHLKKWLYWPWAVYPVLRDAQAVFFTCEEERRLARQSFWLYRCNEVPISYGTEGVPDPARDYREAFASKHPVLRDMRQFLFLGRVAPKKGPDLFIRAVAALLREGIWDRATMRIVMAGPTDGAYGDFLRTLAKREGVDELIYWTGMVLGDEKWGVLQSAEVFILPSHQENFGIAVAEALSVGTPVLIAKPVNIWPEIVNAGAGFAEEDTLEGTIEMLKRWLALDTAGRNLMRAKSVECFRRNFTADEAAYAMTKQIALHLPPPKA